MNTVPPERWRRIEEVLDGALDLAPGERAAFLDRECEGDATLRSAVDALLRATEQPSGLPRSPARLAAPFLAELAGEERDASATPERVGPWRIIREIGHGGMGTVYLAERDDEQFRKQVAVKLLRHGVGSDDLTRRFRHERQILATLEHPHIARMLDGGIAEGAPYIVMEFIDGMPLDAHCRERGLSVADRLALFVDVCDAVQYAHQHLVIHRDLKPDNVYLVPNDMMPGGIQVKLLDFGIAKLADDRSSGVKTQTGALIGTPAYMSPEQCMGAAELDHRTDLYSLGCILFHVLCGRPP
ncbi:MAG: serine/threonine-protein kinase, partial [Gemmatimonadota bacterium]